MLKPQHRSSPWSPHITTDGRPTLYNKTSQTEHHNDGMTYTTLMTAWLSITNQLILYGETKYLSLATWLDFFLNIEIKFLVLWEMMHTFLESRTNRYNSCRAAFAKTQTVSWKLALDIKLWYSEKHLIFPIRLPDNRSINSSRASMLKQTGAEKPCRTLKDYVRASALELRGGFPTSWEALQPYHTPDKATPS
jgi:hypothetical protein